LMLGRGAIADPKLFQRIRGLAPQRPTGAERQGELATHIALLLSSSRCQNALSSSWNTPRSLLPTG
jgi:hypothetical protein